MSESNPVIKEPVMKKRHAIAAFFIAFGAQGLGQLYNDQPKKALFFPVLYFIGDVMMFTPLVFYPIPMLFVLVILVGCSLYAIIDAAVTARRIKLAPVHFYQRWYSLLLIGVIWWSFVLLGTPVIKRIAPIQAFRIPTGSMEPTIDYGDCVVADKSYYSEHSIQPGDLAIFYYPTDSVYKYISRCLAVAGDTVVIRNRVPYVNGKVVPSPGYSLGVWWPIAPKDSVQPGVYPPGAGNADNYGPVVVPEGKCFMLSDNISNALDSRFKGYVDLKKLVAKPLYIYWSAHLNRIGRELK